MKCLIRVQCHLVLLGITDVAGAVASLRGSVASADRVQTPPIAPLEFRHRAACLVRWSRDHSAVSVAHRPAVFASWLSPEPEDSRKQCAQESRLRSQLACWRAREPVLTCIWQSLTAPSEKGCRRPVPSLIDGSIADRWLNR
jgi:hypothetical protein